MPLHEPSDHWDRPGNKFSESPKENIREETEKRKKEILKNNMINTS